MSIQTFRAKTMREALAQVRHAFGADAAILHTREVDPGPLARWLKGKTIEVVARPIEKTKKERPQATATQDTEQVLEKAYKGLLHGNMAPELAHRLIASARQQLPIEALREPILVEEFLVGAIRDQLRGAFSSEQDFSSEQSFSGEQGALRKSA